MRNIDEIIIHCSATKPGWMAANSADAKRDEIRRWHLAKRWNDIGYHMIIDRDGSVAAGRPVEKSGAHTSGHNANSLGVCLIGGFESKRTDQFSDHYTPEQNATLHRIIKEWSAAIPNDVLISGHNQYSNKGCPGFDVGLWLAQDVKPVQRPSPVKKGGIAAIVALIAAAIAKFFGLIG